MGSKPKAPKQQKAPPPPPIPKTAEAYQAGDAAMLRERRGSSYAQSFLVGNGNNLGGGKPQTGYTSFLGGS